MAARERVSECRGRMREVGLRPLQVWCRGAQSNTAKLFW
ncbi:antitoxin MazE-like protein [Mycolicibacterium novocastrense]|nr:antitoxin MazE-like protein [Mycolicibacterium novocastrense]